MVTSPTTSETPAELIGSHWRSSPIPVTSWSRRWTVGDGDLTDRFGEFAVTDPQTLCPGGEITRYRVDARVEPGDALDEEAVVDAVDQVGLALLSGEERERLGTDGRAALEATSDGRTGRGRSGTTGGIRIVQEGLQFAVDDQGGGGWRCPRRRARSP